MKRPFGKDIVDRNSFWGFDFGGAIKIKWIEVRG
jgi:hypothetical protein